MTTIAKSNLIITARNEVVARYCPGRGVSLQGGLSPNEVSVQGVSVRGWGFSVQGGGGISVQRGVCVRETHPLRLRAGGTHPTGMHSCANISIDLFINRNIVGDKGRILSTRR